MSLRTEAGNTLKLLTKLDDELRLKPWWRLRPARRIDQHTWALLVTQAVMLSASIGTYDALEGRRNG